MTYLPSKKVNIGGITYIIYGLLHDHPLISLSKEFKNAINEELKGHNVICEDGFVDWISNSISFNELKHLNLNKFSFFNLIKTLKGYLYNKYIIKSHKTNFAKQVQRIKTIDDFLIIRKELLKSYSKEPEGMNFLLLENNNGTLDNSNGKLPLRVRRYLFEASESMRYAISSQLKELIIVVGCAHELPLEYLLSNPDIVKYHQSLHNI